MQLLECMTKYLAIAFLITGFLAVDAYGEPSAKEFPVLSLAEELTSDKEGTGNSFAVKYSKAYPPLFI